MDKPEKSASDLWLDEYLETGDAIKAVEHHFPDAAESSRAVRASQLKTRHAERIDSRLREAYKKDAPQMVKISKDLAVNAKQDAVKLKAAQDWLSRAGHDAALVIEEKPMDYETLKENLKIAMQGFEAELLKEFITPEVLETLRPRLDS